jgi:hypothetical protein
LYVVTIPTKERRKKPAKISIDPGAASNDADEEEDLGEDKSQDDFEPFSGVNKKQVFAEIFKTVILQITQLQEELSEHVRAYTSRWKDSQDMDFDEEGAEEKKKVEQEEMEKQLFLLRRVKFFLDGANEHNQFFYDSDGEATPEARKLVEMGWDIIKSAAGCTPAFQILDNGPFFRRMHQYFEPANFINNVDKVLPPMPMVDEFIDRKLMSRKGNFANIDPALRNTFAIGLRHICSQVGVIFNQPTVCKSFQKLLQRPILDTDEDKLAHALGSMQLYLKWNELSEDVAQELLSKVPEGIGLVARYGELHENHYEELFPKYDFMQIGAKDRRVDGRGSLTRKRTLLWTHPYILEKNRREHEEKEAEKQRMREAKETKERAKIEEDTEKQKIKEGNAAKAAAREEIRAADIWHCMNLSCAYKGPATEEWLVCQYYKQKNGCKIFVCNECVEALNVHEANCIYAPGALVEYRHEQEAKAQASQPKKSSKKKRKDPATISEESQTARKGDGTFGATKKVKS